MRVPYTNAGRLVLRRREELLEDRIEYFERMLADNPNNPTGLLALANEYGKAGRDEDEAVTLERYVSTHDRERTGRQHPPWMRFSAPLTGDNAGRVELTRAQEPPPGR
jgi:hypothetical protein